MTNPADRRLLTDYLGGLELRWFEPREFLVATDRAGNDFPPPSLWNQVGFLAYLVDELRDRLRVPVVISSCYRAPAYNAKVGGAAASQHQAFRAADIVAAGLDADQVGDAARGLRGEWIPIAAPAVFRSLMPVAADVAVGRGLTVAGVALELRPDLTAFRYRGGVGSYPRWTHVDTRGVDANWNE